MTQARDKLRVSFAGLTYKRAVKCFQKLRFPINCTGVFVGFSLNREVVASQSISRTYNVGMLVGGLVGWDV